ncbi:thiosulfate oxidation carrier complex protein SoxZ [Prosthecochloris sp. CIB 2401]|uniref:thiosulfate oxidation carrier complex protein SoxZ n=1 Tax=Prosthecochloris sp. CIB 2401 TaxID=1868325 RepID=UPI00080AAD4B|nr:thiosulfate oxidation carrier complex protein SoxZ [Prosthecochloris sp. CIB 2401]ANT64638.1 putative secreted protein [Prosthecochloris sp. CIB 2401]
MKVRAILRDATVQVKMLIKHPMETGRRKDEEGNILPAHYITEIKAVCKGDDVFRAEVGPGVSMDPYISFAFDGANTGDTLTISWKDNKGESETLDVVISGA